MVNSNTIYNVILLLCDHWHVPLSLCNWLWHCDGNMHQADDSELCPTLNWKQCTFVFLGTIIRNQLSIGLDLRNDQCRFMIFLIKDTFKEDKKKYAKKNKERKKYSEMVGKDLFWGLWKGIISPHTYYCDSGFLRVKNQNSSLCVSMVLLKGYLVI